NHVALAHVVFHPFQIDGDVAFHEVKPWVREQGADPLGLQVHAVDMPIGVSQYVLAQVMTDESIDPENENVFQDKSLLKILMPNAAVVPMRLSPDPRHTNADVISMRPSPDPRHTEPAVMPIPPSTRRRRPVPAAAAPRTAAPDPATRPARRWP